MAHLIKLIKNQGVVKYDQQHKLKNGEMSSVYFDFRELYSNFELMQQLALELSEKVSVKNPCLVGIELGGVPFATLISQILKIPMVILRSSAKEYGTGGYLAGNIPNGCNAVLIEDVITTGGTVIDAIKKLKELQIVTSQVIAILDRGKGGIQNISKYQAARVNVLYDIGDFLNLNNKPGINSNISSTVKNKLFNIINSKKTNLVLSLDVIIPIKLLENMFDYVCAIKIHSDLLSFSYIKDVITLAKSRGILIIEDRKLADVEHISVALLTQSYADIITTYYVNDDIMLALDKQNIGLLIIYQLSVPNSIITPQYQDKVIKIIPKLTNFIGLVAPQNTEINSLPIFTPGISSIDDIKKGNLFIIGRAIYNASDPIAELVKYRNTSYSRYISE